MAGAYSTDLRERVPAAVEAGETPEAAARRFAMGRSTAYRWARAARHFQPDHASPRWNSSGHRNTRCRPSHVSGGAFHPCWVSRLRRDATSA